MTTISLLSLMVTANDLYSPLSTQGRPTPTTLIFLLSSGLIATSLANHDIRLRIREIVRIKALGVSRSIILGTMLFKIGLVGFMGSLFGAALGTAIRLLLSEATDGLAIVDRLLLLPSLALLACLLGALPPSWKGCNINPPEALR